MRTTGGPGPSGSSDAALNVLLGTLSVPEKVALVVGADVWSTTALPQIGLRGMVMSDGPAGVRGTGVDPAETSASFPAPSALAATWDRELLARAGSLLAAEARHHGVDVVLAPQVNLQRTPGAGRHFECYSEDPLLTAELASALVLSVQRHGVGMCPKHFVANDSETDRTTYLAQVDQRTLHEVYLAPFERLVADGAWLMMAAYSGLDDGMVAAPVIEHRPLLHDVLKVDWGFDGVVVSDWLATTSVGPAVRAGLDLQMPGPDGPWGDGLLAAVQRGDVAEADLNDKVLRLLRLATRVGALGGGSPTPSTRVPAAPDTDETLRLLAARSIVVLKDDAGLIPLPVDSVRSIALLGPAALAPFSQGGGSAFVHADHLLDPVTALAAALPPTVRLEVAAGARSRVNPPPLDLAARGVDPITGAAGARLELLDRDGTVVGAQVTTAWTGWLRPSDWAAVADSGVVTLRLCVDIRLEAGRHDLGIGTVGRHRISVDGRVVSSSGQVVAQEVILDSTYNHPRARLAQVFVTTPRTVRIEADLQVVHSVGYDSFVRGALVHRPPGPGEEEELAHAVALAAAADFAVVVVGTTEEVESEGFDRGSLALPGNQDELVRRVLAANPNTVVVINAGAPLVLPWYCSAGTVLWAWLGGQECGGGLADVLTGRTEPTGRLPWTLPARESDVPVPAAIPDQGRIAYTEGVHIGYRGWERENRDPAACFGHGLGWTTWSYRSVTVLGDGETLELEIAVENTGTRSGREVVQAYLEPPSGGGQDRPVRWLAGFAVVAATAGEIVTVRLSLPRRTFEIWDVDTNCWRTPPGRYLLRIGRSLRDLRLDLPIQR